MKTKRRFVCTVYTLRPTELCPTRPPGQDLEAESLIHAQPGRGVWRKAFLTNPKKTHKRRWGERDALHKRKVSGPRNCLGPLDPRTRREPSGGGAQTDQRKVTAKAMCKNWKPSFRPHPFLPSLILSVCSEWMFSPRGRYQSEGVDRARPGFYKVLKHYQVF